MREVYSTNTNGGGLVNQDLSTAGDTLVMAPGTKNYQSATQASIDEQANGNTAERVSGSSALTPIPGKPKLEDDALYGLPGDIVKTVDEYTEADPAAILVNILVMYGNVIGRGPYFKVEETLHHTNLFTALTGPSSTGRKRSKSVDSQTLIQGN